MKSLSCYVLNADIASAVRELSQKRRRQAGISASVVPKEFFVHCIATEENWVGLFKYITFFIQNREDAQALLKKNNCFFKIAFSNMPN